MSCRPPEGKERINHTFSMHAVYYPEPQPCADVPFEGLRINHYLRSLQDYEAKVQSLNHA
jgi:hypothetical protein